MLDNSLNELIGSIYDAVIDPSRWHGVIDEIRRRYNFEIAMLSAISLTSGTPVVHVSANVPEDFERMAASYNNDVVELWGGPARLAELPAEEPIIVTEVLEPVDWEANRFYLEWCKPQGLEDQVVIQLGMDASMVATLGLGRHVSKLPVTLDEMRDLRIIAPHLRRAVVISHLLDGATGRADTFEAALSAMSSAAVIVDADMRVLHANALGHRMLDDGDPIRSSAGKLDLPGELVPGQLEAAVRATTGPESELRRRGLGIPTRRRNGAPLVVHVMPLVRRRGRSGLERSAAAAVFVSETGARSPLPMDAVNMLFELTPAEGRVFELLATGHSIPQIAEALAVAETTVKTHLASVYGKTSTNRRGDLVRLASELGLRT